MRKEATEWDTREMGRGRGDWAVYLTFKQVAGVRWCGRVCGEHKMARVLRVVEVVASEEAVTVKSEQGLSTV
jgi:hypothetical protein